LLYAISTHYHSVGGPLLKVILHKCDHSAIYLLIAGSYTPFTLVTSHGPWGWSLLRGKRAINHVAWASRPAVRQGLEHAHDHRRIDGAN